MNSTLLVLAVLMPMAGHAARLRVRIAPPTSAIELRDARAKCVARLSNEAPDMPTEGTPLRWIEDHAVLDLLLSDGVYDLWVGTGAGMTQALLAFREGRAVLNVDAPGIYTVEVVQVH